MQIAAWLLRLLAVSALFAAAPAWSDNRSIIPLESHWRFVRAEAAGAQQPAFDDKDWLPVTLPHSFNSGDGEQPDYYRGPAWYRRAFDVRTIRTDRRLFLQFDGAALRADVWLNGRYVGRHDGGHSAFRFDITDALVPGRNLIAVRVDNSHNKAIAPLGGDFTIFGGLYRPVSLIEVDPVHIDLTDHGGPGVYVRSQFSRMAGVLNAHDVTARVRVANGGARSRQVPLTVRILDPEGREAARGSARLRVGGGSVRSAEIKMTLLDPKLWDGVRSPHLYRAIASVGQDQVSVTFGIRNFHIDPARGFFLNGRPYPLRGANLMHSARPGRGTAVTDAEIVEDFAILKDMGSTGIRLTHFQHPRKAYDEADRLGLATWTEIGINSAVEDLPEFRANAAQQLRELIAQNYNHPSVMMWGLGNEVYSTEPHVASVLSELHAVAKAADPDRPTVYAHCCQDEDDPKANLTDVLGFNKYFGWYPDQKGTFGEFVDRVHARKPSRAIGISEYGAGASILHQEDPPRQPEPGGPWHPEQYQSLFHERSWMDLKIRPYLWSTFVWVAFDLASGGRKEGDRPGINDKGLVTYDRRIRKDAYYWYRANWSAHATLYITGRRFTRRTNPDVEVKVYTNQPLASLYLNGKAIGTVAAAEKIARWRIRLTEGTNRIEVRSGVLTDTVDWHYENPPTIVRPETR
jgi:hypothetical protein